MDSSNSSSVIDGFRFTSTSKQSIVFFFTRHSWCRQPMKDLFKLEMDQCFQVDDIKHQRRVVRNRRAFKGGEGYSIEVKVRKIVHPIFEVIVPGLLTNDGTWSDVSYRIVLCT